MRSYICSFLYFQLLLLSYPFSRPAKEAVASLAAVPDLSALEARGCTVKEKNDGKIWSVTGARQLSCFIRRSFFLKVDHAICFFRVSYHKKFILLKYCIPYFLSPFTRPAKEAHFSAVPPDAHAATARSISAIRAALGILCFRLSSSSLSKSSGF